MEARIEAIIRKMREADAPQMEVLKQELVTMGKSVEGTQVREIVERLMRHELLELRWELEEVADALQPPKPIDVEPPKAPAPPPPPPEEPETGPVKASDLTLVYDDPRGLLLYRTRSGKRWFATQVDPSTGKPQTFELHASEIDAVKAQLAGSPYWVLGEGA